MQSDWEKSQRGGWLKLDPTKNNDRGKAMISKENVPGPGQYSAKTGDKSGPAYSMQSRYTRKDEWQTPGPGNYKTHEESSYYKACGIGTSQRSTLGRGDKSKEPGPGHYAHTDNRNSLSYSVGKSVRQEAKKLAVPGPGAYKVPYMVTQVPSYVMQKSEFKYV